MSAHWSDPYSKLAASKLPENEREGFQVYMFEATDAGILLTGTWPQRVYSKGPRKGEPDYRSGINARGTRRVCVTEKEYDDARKEGRL